MFFIITEDEKGAFYYDEKMVPLHNLLFFLCSLFDKYFAFLNMLAMSVLIRVAHVASFLNIA